MFWDSWVFNSGPKKRLSRREAAELHNLLFDDPDDLTLADVLYLWCEQQTNIETVEGRAKLPEPARNLVLVNMAKGIVDNGGLSYLMSSGIRDLRPIPAAFTSIGADYCASILSRAIEFFPPGEFSESPEGRCAYIDRHPEEWARITDLDNQFYRYSRQFWRLLGSYLRRHQDELRAGRPFPTDDTRKIPARRELRIAPDSTDEAVMMWVNATGGHAYCDTFDNGKSVVSLTVNPHRRCVAEDFALVSQTEFAHKVTSLSLDGCGLTEAELAPLTRFQGMDDLKLGGNDVNDESLTYIIEHRNIGWLDLDSAELTEIGFRRLSRLENLEVLYLRYVQPTASGILALGSLARLKHLCLMSTVIDGDCCQAFRQLEPLESLDLRECQITPERIPDLQAHFATRVLHL